MCHCLLPNCICIMHHVTLYNILCNVTLFSFIALATEKCEPCPKNYKQPYYGATDCMNKPKLVSKLSAYGVYVEGTSLEFRLYFFFTA